jgi:hypothetical protein
MKRLPKPKIYPFGPLIEPSLATWKQLFAAIKEFCVLQPWEYFENGDVFGVIDPVTGRPAAAWSWAAAR